MGKPDRAQRIAKLEEWHSAYERGEWRPGFVYFVRHTRREDEPVEAVSTQAPVRFRAELVPGGIRFDVDTGDDARVKVLTTTRDAQLVLADESGVPLFPWPQWWQLIEGQDAVLDIEGTHTRRSE